MNETCGAVKFDFARHFRWMDGLNCASGLDTDSKSRRLCVIAHLQHQTSDTPHSPHLSCRRGKKDTLNCFMSDKEKCY